MTAATNGQLQASMDRQEFLPGEDNAPLCRFDTGAVRGTDANGTRYDLVSPIAMRRVAETYAEGAVKYGPNNWLQGMPAFDILNHAMKHLEQWRGGDVSEDHLAHAAWNLFALMHFEETRPELFSGMPYRGK